MEISKNFHTGNTNHGFFNLENKASYDNRQIYNLNEYPKNQLISNKSFLQQRIGVSTANASGYYYQMGIYCKCKRILLSLAAIKV
jgi:hypothetical protein